MPSTTRQNIKQSLDYCQRDLVNAQELLVKVAIPFESVHKEHFELLSQLVAAIELIKEQVKSFSDKV
jgi:hypothetical protein